MHTDDYIAEKVFEKQIRIRLAEVICELAPGAWQGLEQEDVTLDVRNAFDFARLADVLDTLEKSFVVPGYPLRILRDYLGDQLLL